ncbi:MAG TPA: aspartate aminotransferase family protein [Dehalococcoidia bacterium]|nr:aspartate aminotransferase family protein [Dehalococcoidia bacterium]
MQTEDWIAVEKEHYFQTGKRLPVVLERGEGTKVWDDNGKEYLDFVGGIAVTSLGHAHPVIVEALTNQAKKLISVSNYYYTTPQLKLARLLSEISGLDRAFFCNSGAEAVEGLIKLARKFGKEKRDGAYEIIVCEGAFHGRTLATVTASANERYRAPFTPLPEGFPRVPFNDIDAVKAATTGKTAAVLVEPLQGEGGVNVPDDDYLPQLRAWCDEAGILLLLDEVQTGAGRTGKMFAFQHYGILPDALAVAKAMAGGVPIGAFLAREELALLLAPGEHGTTFGGNALACEVAHEVLSYMITNDLPAQVTQRGQHFERRLTALADRQPMITEIRGRGLIWAVELDRPASDDIVAKCLEAGLLVNGVKPTALRFLPPFTVSEGEIDAAVEIVDRALHELSEEK